MSDTNTETDGGAERTQRTSAYRAYARSYERRHGAGSFGERCRVRQRVRRAATRSPEALAKKANDKRLQRLRRRMVGLGADGRPSGKTLTHIRAGGAKHPLSCPCYDCLYGEVAQLKKIAKQPGGGRVPLEEPRPGRTGKVMRPR
jgi:hypothetical protein